MDKRANILISLLNKDFGGNVLCNMDSFQPGLMYHLETRSIINLDPISSEQLQFTRRFINKNLGHFYREYQWQNVVTIASILHEFGHYLDFIHKTPKETFSMMQEYDRQVATVYDKYVYGSLDTLQGKYWEEVELEKTATSFMLENLEKYYIKCMKAGVIK